MRFLWVNDKTEGGGAVKLFGAARRVLEKHGHQLAPFFGLYGLGQVDPEWVRFQPPRVEERDPRAIALRAFPSRAVNRKLEEIIAAFRPDVAVVQNVHQYLSPAVFNTLRAHGIPIVFLLNDYALYCVNRYAFREGSPCHQCLDRHYVRGVIRKCSLKSGSIGFIEASVRAASLRHSRLTHAFESAGAVYTNGQTLARRVMEYGFPADRIVSGIFPLDLSPDVRPLEEPWNASEYFAYYGGEAPAKGQLLLLEAVNLLDSPLQLKMCLLRPSEALADRVRALNSSGTHDVELDTTSRWETGVLETVQSARAVVIPSLWDSPHELVIYESFALGKAVIVAAGTGNADLVEDHVNGLLFERGNAQSLANCIRRLAEDRALAQELGKGARATYEDRLRPEMWYEPFMRAVDIAMLNADI